MRTVHNSSRPSAGGGGGCLLQGDACSGGVPAPRRVVPAWGGGVSAVGGAWSRGCLLPGGGGGIPACTEADSPCEQNDRQV